MLKHPARTLLTLPKVLPPHGRIVCPCMHGARNRVMLISMEKETHTGLTDYIAASPAQQVSGQTLFHSTILPSTMAREDRSEEFTGVLGFFICICTLTVLLRCYCKLVIVKNFAADDYFSVLTLVSFLVFCTLALLGIHNGTGKRRYLIPDDKYPMGMKVCSAASTTCLQR